MWLEHTDVRVCFATVTGYIFFGSSVKIGDNVSQVGLLQLFRIDSQQS